jgi:hypothetical protein
MSRRTLRGLVVLVLTLLCCAQLASSARAETGEDLRSPKSRSTRFSAYSLPKGTWAIEAGALGLGNDELYGEIGGAVGLGAGFQLDVNLAHYGVGLFNISSRWNFLDTRHVALSLGLSFLYGHGDWVWILSPLAERLIEDTDLFSLPVNLTASVPVTHWLQFDLTAEYQYAKLIGQLGEGKTLYADALIGAERFVFRPGARFFLSDTTALELAALLPAFTKVPYEGTLSAELLGRGFQRSGEGEAKIAFSETWNLEVGLRSRFTPWMFGSFRLTFGPLADRFFSAPVYPTFSLEFRL